MNEDRGTRYQRLRRQATLVAAGSTLVYLTAAATASFGATLRDLVSQAGGATQTGPAVVATAVLCGALLAAGIEILLFPILLIGVYRLDRRYGVERRSLRRWCTDQVTSSGLAVVGASVAAGVVYGAKLVWPTWWWAPASLAFAAIAAGVLAIAPRLVTPLRGEGTGPIDAALRARIDGMMHRTGLGAIPVYVQRDGRHASPALVGLGRTRAVLLPQSWIESVAADEVESVLAHELAHHVRHDAWRMLVVETVVCAMMLAATHTLASTVLPRFGIVLPSDVAGLPQLAAMALLVFGGLLPATRAISRQIEREADRQALEWTRNPDAFARAIRRVGAARLTDEDPPLWVRLFFYGHPPVARRLEAVRRWAEGHQNDVSPSA